MRKYFVPASALALAALTYVSPSVHSRGPEQTYQPHTAAAPAGEGPLAAAVAGRFFSSATAGSAADFTVDSLADTPDALLADGLCADSSGACTLRAAIEQANSDPSADSIAFGVAGTVNLTRALPDLSTDITVNGPGADQLTVRRGTGGDYRIFTIRAGVTAGISGLTVNNGRSPTVAGSTSPGGGGGGVFNSGTLSMADCAVSGNSTAEVFERTTNTGGGGIRNEGTLSMAGCIVSNNVTGGGGTTPRAVLGFAGGDGGDGGGIASPGTLKLSNSTVARNTAGPAGIGRDGVGGGVHGKAQLRSTIIALNNTHILSEGRDVSGSFDSSGHNYVGSSGGGCCFADSDRLGHGADPDAVRLGPLASNGGPTQTHALLPGSPAIDAGLARDLDGQPVTADQRGSPRPSDDPAIPPQAGGDDSDIGAFERQSTDPTPAPTPTPAPDTTVQLIAATSRVTEGCAGTEFTVTRTGPKDGTTEATYAVGDRTASQRGDFTHASGRVRFAPGEDAKTIPVLISDDAYAEGTEELLVSLTSVTGGRAGFPNPIAIQIEDDETADGTSNPMDDPAAFVCQHYHDFLNRQPDPGGQAFWTGQLASCGGDPGCLADMRENVSAAFFLSLEFQQTGYYVIRTYAAAIGELRYTTFLADTQEIGRGVVVGEAGSDALLEANKRRYVEQAVNRPGFQNIHGGQNAQQYVDSLFANTGATPTRGERQAALDAFGPGDAAGRARSLRSVIESGSVYNRLYNPAFVQMQYFGYLRRNPSNPPDHFALSEGYHFWLNKLNNFSLPGEDVRDPAVAFARIKRAEMVEAFIRSTEYRGRFHGDPRRGQPFGTISTLRGAGDRRRALARSLRHGLGSAILGRA